MSKLLKQYEELKKKTPEKIYIFKVGIFYNILNEDAKIVSSQIGLKLTDLGPNIIKIFLLKLLQIQHPKIKTLLIIILLRESKIST